MIKPKLVVRHREETRGEVLVVRLATAADVPSTPTAIDKLPFAVIDLDGVPCVALGFRRQGCARRQSSETIAFSMASNDYRFEPGLGGESREEGGVAFADGKSCREGVGRSRGFDSVVEEGDDVVGDVVVKPGEDSTGFVRYRGERGGELGS